jgi:hypothetical protein
MEGILPDAKIFFTANLPVSGRISACRFDSLLIMN